MSISGQYAGIRHRAAGCGNDVEAFCSAEICIAGFVADGAERGFGEEARILGFGGGAFGGLGGLLRGRCWFCGLRRIGVEGETSEGEGSGELGKEGFEG